MARFLCSFPTFRYANSSAEAAVSEFGITFIAKDRVYFSFMPLALSPAMQHNHFPCKIEQFSINNSASSTMLLCSNMTVHCIRLYPLNDDALLNHARAFNRDQAIGSAVLLEPFNSLIPITGIWNWWRNSKLSDDSHVCAKRSVCNLLLLAL